MPRQLLRPDRQPISVEQQLVSAFAPRTAAIENLPQRSRADRDHSPLGDHALKIVVLNSYHEGLAAPLDRQRLADDVIAAPPQETRSRALRTTSGSARSEPEEIECDEALHFFSGITLQRRI
jgi:hypothetical protein